LLLEELAAIASALSPGAAAALVDWNGAEVARLRAFGIVHGVLLRDVATLAPESLEGAAAVVAA
jgi:hypothetical protein